MNGCNLVRLQPKQVLNTGDTMYGDLILNNTVSLQARETNGKAANLATMKANNTIDIGDEMIQLHLCSVDIPNFWDGIDQRNYLIYTHKNKPTPGEIGQLKEEIKDLKSNGGS